MSGPPNDPMLMRTRRDAGAPDWRVVAASLLIGGLAVAAVVVAFVLPGQVQRPESRDEAARTAAPAPMTAAPAPVAADAQKTADEQKTAVLRRLAKLEGEGVRIWGVDLHAGASLGLAEAALAKANDAALARSFSAAIQFYRDAEAILDTLDATRPGRLAAATEQGAAALARLDASIALKQFELAAALAPGDPQAAKGLERARKLPGAIARLQAGDAAMAVNDLPKAREAYRQALGIDADLEPASSRLRQVEGQLATQEYQKAVSEVVARLRDGNTRAAGAALDRAQRLRPNAPELAELRAQHAGAAKLGALRDLQSRAEAMEREENWQEAVKLYHQAMALDPNAIFAAQGLARAQQQAALHDAIDSYLANPDRLRSVEPRSHAQAILQLARSAGNGPVIGDKTRRLASLLTAAQTPVPVRLKSDNATDVEIYRVGIVGAFAERQLLLVPGRYTAIGRRSGFRDVRVQFDVIGGTAPQEVIVQCTEKIR